MTGSRRYSVRKSHAGRFLSLEWDRELYLAFPLFTEQLEAWPCQLYLLGQHVDEVGAKGRCAMSISTFQAEVHAPAELLLKSIR